MKLVSISRSGLATGFYDINNSDAPIDAFEISNILYEVWVDNTDTMKWDKNLEDLVEIESEIDVEELKNIGLLKIDNIAENARQQIMTIGYGQALVYIEKFEEATDYVVYDYPSDLSPYPFIKHESLEFDVSPKIIADKILAKKSEWINKASKIESARLMAKEKIRNMEQVSDINTVISSTTKRIEDIV